VVKILKIPKVSFGQFSFFGSNVAMNPKEPEKGLGAQINVKVSPSFKKDLARFAKETGIQAPELMRQLAERAVAYLDEKGEFSLRNIVLVKTESLIMKPIDDKSKTDAQVLPHARNVTPKSKAKGPVTYDNGPVHRVARKSIQNENKPLPGDRAF
jgi:hypothetical protein